MKTIIFMGIFLFSSLLIYSQPTDATLLAKIKSDSKNLISAKLKGRGISEKQHENGSWKYYYRKSYESKSKTAYQGITQVYNGGIQYIKSGSAYVFDRFLIGDAYYLGLPDPNKEEIITLLKSDFKKFLGSHHYNKIVGEVSEITFPTNPEWHWHTLKSVSFKVKVTYSESISYTQIEKAIHTYKVRLYADEYKGSWKSFLSNEEKNERKQLEVKTYTADEVRAMKSLSDLDAENKVKNQLADLPKIGEIPSFESDKQMFYFLHEKIMKENTKTVEAYLHKMMSKNCYEENSQLVLKSWADKWYKNIKTNHKAYQIAHCEYPKVKKYQAGQITFYDKENRRMLRMVADFENDIWKIREISFYAPNKSEQERMKNLKTNCQEKPNLEVRKVVVYNIGDKVNGKFSNGKFPCTINKIDPQNRNRYFLKLVGDKSGKGYWMEEKFIEKATASATSNDKQTNSDNKQSNSNNNSNTQQTFKVGDKVQVKSVKGILKGTIIKKASGKYLIDFKSPLYGDTWVSAKQMTK